MPVNRELFTATFEYDDVPAWPCPNCANGTLIMNQTIPGRRDTTFVTSEADARTQRFQRSEEYEEGHDTGRFAAILQCASCREVVSLCGETESRWGNDPSGEPIAYHVFDPKFFWRELPIIRMPAACTQPIRNEVQSAFRVYWADPNSCLNRLRAACELFVADLLNSSGGVPAGHNSLGHRLGTVRQRFPQLHEVADTARILGNEGSHPGTVTKLDALDGFDVIDHLLDAVHNPDNLRRIVEEIRASNGPRPRTP